LGLNSCISSGDKNPADLNLQTFYPLFPKGLYYGYIDDSGSLNAIVVHPQVSFQVSKDDHSSSSGGSRRQTALIQSPACCSERRREFRRNT
jgi:hypothetical protein